MTTAFSRSLPVSSCRRRPALAALAAVIQLSALPLFATTHSWTDTSGNGLWTTATNWSPNGLPITNDSVIITGGPSLPLGAGWTVTYNYNGPAVTLNTLTLTHSNTKLFFTANILNIADNGTQGGVTAQFEFIGDSSSGGSKGLGVINQSGGFNNVQNILILGRIATDGGTYNLSGDGFLDGNQIVAEGGFGTFTQSSGTNNISGPGTPTLTIGDLAGSSGTYNLQGGTLYNYSGQEIIGNGGAANFTQTGGVNSPGTAFNATSTIWVGNSPTGNGTYNLQGGSLTANAIYLGAGGAAAFNHSNGTATLASATSQPILFIGYVSAASYALSGTGSLAINNNGQEIIGNAGAGTFTQDGGSHTLNSTGGGTPQLHLAFVSGSTGSYTLNSGALILNNGLEYVGDGGNGTFTQTGGTHTITFTGGGGGQLFVGYQAGATGNYSLSNGSLTVSGNEFVGNNGNGTFTQSGGTNTVATINGGSAGAQLLVGAQPGGVGTYFMNGGTLSAGYLGVGMPGATGTFVQTAGNITCQTLGLGNFNLTARGTYSLSDGNLTLVGSSASAFLPGSGNGTFSQSGGTFSTANGTTAALYVASTAGATGSYALSNGSIAINGSEYIGDSGNANFTQSGGTNTVTGPSSQITLANNNGSNGNYTLSNGTLTAGSLNVGVNGHATFTQTGGTANATIWVALTSGFSTYSLAAPGIINSAQELIGGSGFGSFTQTGGTNTCNNNFFLGSNPGGFGTYTLSAGNLSVAGFEYLAQAGTATFTQTGGNHTLPNAFSILEIAQSANSTASYALSGLAKLSVGGGEIIGDNGNGTFTQSGGTNTLTAPAAYLAIGAANGTGTYLLNDGSLSAPNIFIGGNTTASGGTGTLTFNTPASLNVSGNITLYPKGTLTGNGATAASVISNGTIIPGSSVSPGTLTLGNLTLNTGAKLRFTPGDLLAVNNLSLNGNSSVALNGLFPSSAPLITYAGALNGAASNLSLFGGSVGLIYKATNDPATQTILASAITVARHSQISVTGQPSPDGNVFTLGLSSGAINDAGQVNFFADMTSFGPTRFDANGFSTIALFNQPAPGPGGGIISSTSNYIDNINASGQTSFQAILASTTDGSTRAQFRGDPTSLIPIIRDQQILPNGGGTVTGFPFASAFATLNNAGQVPVSVLLSGASDTAASAILRGDGLSLTSIARNKQPAPGPGGGTFDVTFGTGPGSAIDPLINNAGQVAFYATLTGTSDGSTSGIFRGNGNAITPYIRNGQSAPGGGTYGLFNYYAFNDANQIAFSSLLNGAGFSSGIFRSDATTTIPIARTGNAAPGPGAGTFGSNFGGILLNNAGQVAFVASLANTTDSSFAGIFRGDGSTPILIARNKQLAPGAGGATLNFDAVNFSLAAFTPGGQVLFVSPLANSPDGNTSAHAAYLSDGIDLVPIAITGQYVSTSQGLRQVGNSIRANTINSFGQVPWSTFFNGTADSGNFLFTPTLHWRSPSSGTWDTATNWTLSLPPAAVHDVIIDPAAPVTITGPVANTTIRSLSISTAGTTLQLSTGGLKLNAPLTLSGSPNAWTSTIDLANRKLVVETTTITKFTALSTLRNQIAFGKNHPGGGITSSALPATLGIALLDNAITSFSTFGGLPVDANSILLSPELLGDANIDGHVDLTDLSTVLNNFGSTTLAWTSGNFDGQPTIDLTDLSDVLNNFGATYANAAESQSPMTNDLSPAPAPEPTTFSLLLLPIALAHLRRKAPWIA